MSRFDEPQHSDFRRLNDSISVDFRLWPHDIAQSRAHARMLAEREIVTAKDAEALLAGLEAGAGGPRGGGVVGSDAGEDNPQAGERGLVRPPGPGGGRP